MKEMFRLVTRSLFALLLFATVVQCQVWVKKEYTKWSKSDCEKLLRDSPWANSYTVGTVALQPIAQEQVAAVPGRDSAPQFTYIAQIWTARPIREAIVRLQQLNGKYDKLGPEEKKAFDDRAAQFLNLEAPEQIVIQVSYSGSQAFLLPMTRFWQQKTQDDLKQTITLIAEGKRVQPVQVVVAKGGGNEFQVIFPRTKDGEPLVRPDMKEIRLEILDPNETINIPFQVKKMKVGDQLIF